MVTRHLRESGSSLFVGPCRICRRLRSAHREKRFQVCGSSPKFCGTEFIQEEASTSATLFVVRTAAFPDESGPTGPLFTTRQRGIRDTGVSPALICRADAQNQIPLAIQLPLTLCDNARQIRHESRIHFQSSDSLCRRCWLDMAQRMASARDKNRQGKDGNGHQIGTGCIQPNPSY